MVLEVFTHELAQRIALATKQTSLDSTLNEEVKVIGDEPVIRAMVLTKYDVYYL